MTKGNPRTNTTTATPAAMDTDMSLTTTTTPTTPNSMQATATTTGHARQTHTRSSSNSSAYTGLHGTTEIGGMSITLPFSSFTPGLTDLTQHTATSLANPSKTIQSSQGLSSDPGSDNLATSSGAQPMAIKPVYKKRAYPSTQRPDGIIKKTGVAAAGEKTQARQAIENATKSRGNIYDRTTGKTRSRIPTNTTAAVSPSHAREPFESPAKKEHIQKQKIGKIVKPPKQPKPKPPKKPKVVKPPRIWTPHQPRSQKPQQASDDQLPGQVAQGDNTSSNSHPPGTIELLIKQHDAHRERLSQLATRPLPLHELQMLVCTELEQEHETLKAMGIMLHKELLKLRLEEGVMLNMLKISEGGVLDVTDLEKIKARKPPSARQLQAYDRMNERHYQKRLRTAKAARAAAIAMRAAMGIHTETTEGDAILNQDKPRVRKTRKLQHPARKRYQTDDDDDDDDEGVQGEEGGEDQGEERADEVETDTDAELTRHRYQAPGESYSFRPSSDQLQGRGAIGRPEASSVPAFVSLEEIKQLVVKRALKRTADDMMEQEADDEDLYELEFDEDEEQPGEEQRGQHDDDEVDQHTDMDMDVDNQYGGEIGDEGEEREEGEEEEGGDEDEDEYYSSDEDGEGPGGDNEEDEDAARLALQRMLSIYGGGV